MVKVVLKAKAEPFKQWRTEKGMTLSNVKAFLFSGLN